MGEMFSFGYWLRRRRRALGLNQAELAERVGCSVVMIRRIEADERRPPKQLAECLADQLALAPAERAAFLKAARTELAADRLAAPAQPGRLPMPELPKGTVTFLFTDIEGSTQLLQRLGEGYPTLLAAYRHLLRMAFQETGGHEVDTQGDAFFVAFPRARDALQAAVLIQQLTASHPWPAGVDLRTRIGLHIGEPHLAAEGYVGLDVHRAARLCAAGHGGQVLLSQATRELVAHDLPSGVSLLDLGQHRLKDLQQPEHIFQLTISDLQADFPPLKTLDSRPNNLPLQPTPFIGREREVAAIEQRLLAPNIRLLTLTGPGGTGKTRLALQVAAELLAEFADGVWFVDLTPISDPALVLSTIATTLGVTEVGGQPLSERLKAYLRDKSLLLVLDNFEQVLAAAVQVAELLRAAPRLKVLVTSRSMLHLAGEHEFPVPPLALPDLQHLPPVEALAQYEAIALFVQRAQAAAPDFAITDANARSIAEICTRLDGLPLALELAAARSKLLAPQALLSRLNQRLKLLTGGARDLPARQQTLRATIDWSYQLLDVSEQILFRRLGVFVGGWTLETAEAVCNAAGDLPLDVLEGVASLAGKSLVQQVEGDDDEPRFTMLETIREYALERLEMSGEAEALRRQHATFYLGLAEQAEIALERPWSTWSTGGLQSPLWGARLEAEHDNLRAALDWALAREELELALCLAGALAPFWQVHGHQTEGCRWLTQALAHASSVPAIVQAKALHAAGRLTLQQGDPKQAQPLLEASLARFQELGARYEMAATLMDLAAVGVCYGEYQRANVLIEASLALWRDVGDTSGIATALLNLGWSHLFAGNLEQAQHLLEESRALWQDLGDKAGIASTALYLGFTLLFRGAAGQARRLLEEFMALQYELDDKSEIASAPTYLAFALYDAGDYAQAKSLLQESLVLLHQQGNKWTSGPCLELLARVTHVQHEPGRAARLFGAAEALREAAGMPISPAKHSYYYDRAVADLRAELGEAAFATAWAEGRAMTLEQAVAYALQEGN